ncbi:hypothetical protein TVAG_216860 [Trichomonas vaginalis G3]|uniref:Uncharacterized protein n=1 Tax=Trichomonas vaginalis (strain ATCC PRA-98 / G3) TaxID=412133 RepID=A2FE92_TRIV3|nr:hypothetical protein TVAGG3_0233650 [Trichomonas vaginalis G3]EAX96783.1 hypothetical protein TVAG_216860 [Trichomonas vaginalis G3]KAI5552826.1 hypothetical protein TVAGG3_0233650 [Trichomonas vaginalis G3]|eukprot:XP_001309713.1 hypothetical protein [Trichomonas vaginalis G3]
MPDVEIDDNDEEKNVSSTFGVTLRHTETNAGKSLLYNKNEMQSGNLYQDDYVISPFGVKLRRNTNDNEDKKIKTSKTEQELTVESTFGVKLRPKY